MMPDIKHMGYGSLTIQLDESNKVELGPRETKDIAVDDLGSDGVQKALADGLIVILPTVTADTAEKKSKSKSSNPNAHE
jgi:hypothetical protein